MKSNKGMGLIPLYSTIIVLIILAGVSLAMLTGDNGLFVSKEKAKLNEEISDAKDMINSALEAIRNEAMIKILQNSNIIEYYTRIDLNRYGIDPSKGYKLVTPEGNETTGITNDGIIAIRYENKEKGIDLIGKIDFKIENGDPANPDVEGSLYGTIKKAQ